MIRSLALAAWVVLRLVPANEEAEGELLEVTPAEREFISQTGRGIASALMERLGGELQAALREGGPVHAISICSERALPLTAEITQAHEGVSVKRVTSRYRNPANAPDPMEQLALQAFETAAAEGSPLPGPLVQKLRRNDGTVYRYYQPLRAATLCLTCHGAPEQMPETLKAAIRERYPEDRAVGYKEGDFRGAIRVEFPVR
ncbi:MAG: DUF3365 domain-containing protein [Acidobacteriota bacterium]